MSPDDLFAESPPPSPARALAAGAAPPERVEIGDDLVMRRYGPGDLEALFAAVTASFDHLHPWMPWLAEPATLEGMRAFDEMKGWAWPSADGGCVYGLFDPAGTGLRGVLGIHDRIGPGGLELGYWCHVDHVGRGVITRSAAWATRLCFAVPGIERVEIHCDQANVPSAAVPRRLGYRLDRIEDDGITAPGESGREMVWIMDRAAFAGSPAERISTGPGA